MIKASPKLSFDSDKLVLPQNFQFPLRAETSLAEARLTTVSLIKKEESVERE